MNSLLTPNCVDPNKPCCDCRYDHLKGDDVILPRRLLVVKPSAVKCKNSSQGSNQIS